VAVRVISHRTRRPFVGPAYDLHRQARAWLSSHGFFDPRRLGLAPGDVQFELTKEAKLAAIRRSGCTHFIDDLPEFLGHPDFPKGVAKVLFDPRGAAPRGAWRRAASWREIARRLLPQHGVAPELRRGLADLLARAGMRGSFGVTPIPGAANNRVFRVEAAGRAFLLKAYFHHRGDRWDRLGAESSFCSHAWRSGLRCLPQPIAGDPRRRLGLYEFIDGRRLSRREVTAATVRQAVDFVVGLNRARPAARAWPAAAEACFSVTEHLRCLHGRLSRLEHLAGSSRWHRKARDFIRGELLPAGRVVDDFVRERSRQLGLPLSASLPLGQRCLSPSDFGFHNALRRPGGRLCFIDFEYAGSDDPAKLVCDFFCQQAVPVPSRYFVAFIRDLQAGLPSLRLDVERIEMLMPVYRLKWCCIILNEFLPVGLARRRFAGSAVRQAVQLRKARALLRDLWRPMPRGS
jgi:hypothetical protein